MSLYEKILDRDVTFIAEMSANHGGSLERALTLVHAAKTAGADCFKTQTYTADTMTLDSTGEDFSIRGGLWDGYTLHRLYAEAAMPWEWNGIIKDECDRLGLDFLSTAFDEASVDYLDGLNVECHKVASFELVDIPLIDYMAAKGKPVILSCGLGSAGDIQRAVDACRCRGNERIILLKCCSEYPAQYEDMNVATIADMRARFGCVTGLSDHSPGSLAPVTAALFGAKVIEKHLCLSRQDKTPDAAFSLEPHEYGQMVADVKNALRIAGRATYELSERERQQTRFRRSVYAVRDIHPGERFSRENCRVIRPGCGLPPKDFTALLGKAARRFIGRGEPVTAADLEEGGGS
jgi:pseudaminic acid synthase